jgi:hypothetical protein
MSYESNTVFAVSTTLPCYQDTSVIGKANGGFYFVRSNSKTASLFHAVINQFVM